MGVKTLINLEQVQELFAEFHIQELTPTSDGVMDTTYIAGEYILKRYERDIKTKILLDEKHLKTLNDKGLNVPLCLAQKDGWYLYSRLKGKVPKNIKLFHIQELARFMAKLHSATYKKECATSFLQEYDLESVLSFTKHNFYAYFKKLQSLQNYRAKNDGLIHGDIFKDNTVFEKSKIGVFDFIDAGCGEFAFDIAVCLVAFNPHKRSLHTELFLRTYNQHAPKKVSKESLLKNIQIAAKFYALLRIENYKNTLKAKELASLW